MELELYQVDAFASQPFAGNPACVVPLESWLDDATMLLMAREHAVAETSFLVRKAPGHYRLRWFTPDLEMDLCGHATLAAAHVVLAHLEPTLNEVAFETQSGQLVVTRETQGYQMALPNRAPEPAILPVEIEESLNLQPQEVHKSRDYMLVYRNEREVEALAINRTLFDRIDLGTGGVIVTAQGKDVDFVSRFFTPQATIHEDPVTGSAHCTSAPFWAARLGQTILHARQLSERGGEVHCQVLPSHVLVTGDAITYSVGKAFLPAQ